MYFSPKFKIKPNSHANIYVQFLGIPECPRKVIAIENSVIIKCLFPRKCVEQLY